MADPSLLKFCSLQASVVFAKQLPRSRPLLMLIRGLVAMLDVLLRALAPPLMQHSPFCMHRDACMHAWMRNTAAHQPRPDVPHEATSSPRILAAHA